MEIFHNFLNIALAYFKFKVQSEIQNYKISKKEDKLRW